MKLQINQLMKIARNAPQRNQRSRAWQTITHSLYAKKRLPRPDERKTPNNLMKTEKTPPS
jgi:hypothetical protein